MRKSFNKKEFNLANKNTSQFKGTESNKKFAAKPYEKKPYEKKAFGDSSFEKTSERKPYEKKAFGEKTFEKKPYEKKAFGDKSFGDKSFEKKPYEKKSFVDSSFEKKPYEKKAFGDKSFEKKPYEKKSFGDKSFEKKPYEKKAFGEKSFEKKPYEKKAFGDKSYEKKPYEKKAFGEKSFEKTSERKPYEKKTYEKRTYEKKSFEEKSSERLREQKFGVFAKKTNATDTKNEAENNANTDTRLNRYIANAGICSRREADALIEAGRITINGEIMKEMGYKVKSNDVVEFDGKKLRKEKLVYVLLNKPKNYITTTDDPEERRTVMSLVEKACPQRIYPVGRLDRNTTGLLLFTNDGELAENLAHPSNNIKKVYQALLDKAISEDDLNAIATGVTLEDGLAPVDKVALLMPDIVGLEIHLGRNRIVRRIFEHLGYEVVKLDRTVYAGLTKKDLPRGEYRLLTEQEVINLKHLGK